MMNARCAKALVLCLVLFVVGLVYSSSALAATGPAYDIKATWGNTNLGAPDAQENQHVGQLYLQARNIGDAASESDLTITDQLPPGVTITNIEWQFETFDLSGFFGCSGLGTENFSCTVPGGFLPLLLPPPGLEGEFGANGYMPPIYLDLSVEPGAVGPETNTATISGGGAASSSDVDQVPLAETRASFGLVPGSFEADVFNGIYPSGTPSRQAGDHPMEQRVNFDITEETGVDTGVGGDGLRYTGPTGFIKDVEVTLPRGMVGNPEATPKCDATAFASPGANGNSTGCPSNTQVGYLNIWFASGTHRHGQGGLSNIGAFTRVAVYNVKPPKGVPADFGFNAGNFVLGHIYPKLDPAQNYAIKTVTSDISSLVGVRGSQVTFWGVPGDPEHDVFRDYPARQEDGTVLGAPFSGAPIRPLLTNPMDCGFDNGGARIRLDSYQDPAFTPLEEYGDPLNVTGCDDPRLHFEPSLTLHPTDAHAGAPTGLDMNLTVPQRNDEVEDAKQLYAGNDFAKGIGAPPIKKVVVTLPQGMTLNPSAAQGLGSCTTGEIGLGTDKPVSCPDSSQYGTLILHTPILPQDNPPTGHVYIAKQGDNPFHNFLSLYLVIEEPERGILVKLPGRADLDPRTGQIATTFDDLPQFPVSDMELKVKGGERAGLVQPSTCGRKTVRAEFFSWHDPATAHLADSSYEIAQKPNGGPCVADLGERSFKPTFGAGTVDNTAGRYAPFVARLARSDEDQEFSQLGVELPEGLTAKLAGVGVCPDGNISRAEHRTAAGDGVLEQIQPSCPDSSLIGSTEVGTGVGVPLTWVPGKVYLAGPYKGAPLSMVAISPAVVGPFDLGVIAVRTALAVDPETAQASAMTDSFPQIFQGVPVRIRDIRLRLDRPGFTLNPTSCARKQINARATGTGGDVQSTADDTAANLSDRFQAADCASLGFKPRLAFRLLGGTRRGAFPRMRATVTYPRRGGYANVASAQVMLPHSEFIENAHFNTVCTRVQFAAKECPAGSIYGRAVAKTPLFDEPLRGPVYLRSSSHKLPDLVAVLRGPASQPVEVDLDGRVDSVHGRLRNTFEIVPDAPVERFTLTLAGGKKGLFVNSTNICAKKNRALAKFTAQNGARLTLRPSLVASCKQERKGHNGEH